MTENAAHSRLSGELQAFVDGLEAEESAGESDHDPLAMPTALLPDFMDGIEAAARLAEQDALEIDLDGVNSKE